MKTTAIWLGGIAVALLIVVILLVTVDLGLFKSTITGFASDYLEREIVIDGPLSIDLGRKVHAAAEGVRVASEDWTEAEHLATVESVELTVDMWALVQGIVLFDDFRASGIRAHLAVDEEGNDNWTFAGLEDDDEEEATPVGIRQAEVSDVLLTYVDPDLPPIEVTGSKIELRERPDGGVDFRLDGTLNDAPLSAAGNVGTLDNVIEGRDVRFAVTAEIGEIAMEGSGFIDDLVEPRKPVVELSVVGPNAEYLTELLDIAPVTTGPFSFEASVSPQDDALAVAVQGTYGEFDLDLTGSVSDLQTPDNLALALHADGPNIDTIARLAGQSGFPEQPFSVDVEVALDGEALRVTEFLFDVGPAQVAATASIPHFPGLDDAQARLTASGPEFGEFNRLLGLPGKLTGPFELTASLDQTASGGDLDARFQAKDIWASAEGTFSDHPELVGSRATVALGGDDVSVIASALGLEDFPAEPFGAGADLTIGDETMAIADGLVTLGQEELKFTGAVGRDPLSTQTRLSLATEIEDLATTMARFGLPTENIPHQGLRLAGEVGRGDDAYLVESLVASLGEVELQVNARIGDSLALQDVAVDFEVDGRNLADLVSLEEAYLSNEPFRVVGQAGFSDEEILTVEDLQIDYGPASARISAKLSVADPIGAGEASIDAQGPSLSSLVPVASEYLPEEDPFSIRGGGRWQGDSLWLEDTTIQVGKATVDVRGELHAPPAIAGTALTVRASMPSLKALELVTEQTLPDEPFDLSAELLAEDDILRLSDFNLSLGESDLSGSASYRPGESEEDVAEFAANFRSRYLDLRPIQAALATEPEEEAPEPEDGRVIPDTALPLDTLRSANGTVELLAERVLLKNSGLSDVQLAANLKDGALVVDRFALTGDRGGTLGGGLRLIPSGDGAEFGLEVDGANLIVGLPAETDEARELLPRYEISTRLAASGTTVRELASTSRGYLRLVANEGSLALGALGFLMQDFAGEVFSSVNPFAKKETYSQVQCFAVLVEVNDGVIEGEPAVILQTDKLNITGVGRVDLSTEKLNARFNTQARKGLGLGVSDLVSPLTEVGGTLGAPRLQLNTAGTIVEGGTAVATVGLSFLAKKARDRWFSDKNPCRRAIEDADKDLAEGGVPLSKPESEPDPGR